MQNNNENYQFHPRGIIKWHAFAAVISSEEQKDMVIDEDIIDIELLDDKKNYLDYLLQEAITNNQKICVSYVENNQIINQEGSLIKIDYYTNTILVNNINIPIKNIIDIIVK
ncbi:MAG: hypothetical protein LBR40_04440 [Bacilli bacterium]|jgi:hypothetical protein|nr:hypothetical protein [Bacilli bacterium]